ncbi:MAG: c-type cytochrome [Planctomycetaceae bacterium]|nr:c-type cytochrome [Planctomycetaceae bacterium]
MRDSIRSVLLLVSFCIPLSAQDDFHEYEFEKRPAPNWVKMIDQGTLNPELTGIQTPDGIKVELFATNPAVIDPVGMAFAPDGTPYVLEWRQASGKVNSHYEFTYQDGTQGHVERIFKDVSDVMKQLIDEDGDGIYESSKIVMDDLQCPSSLMIHDGWFYFPSNGWVIRRRQSEPGGEFDIEEEIVHGLCGFDHHQSSGVTLSHDGWLFVPAGDNDNRGEGTDGSRSTVLRTGAVFRMQPDGSRLHEYARGFRNPYRDVSFDHFYNMFHVDNDQEDGSKFQGVRLMHIAEGADFGWRLYPGAICCRTDFVRGAVFGEKPGKMPAMLKTGRGAPAGLMIYQGTAFPEFFRGLLIYPDVYRKMVRAYEVSKVGATFKIDREFVLMDSTDDLFRPCQALVGPDGAIYIVDWRTPSGGAGRVWGDSEHGRIYRLTWSGIEGVPAMTAGSLKDWKRLTSGSDDLLWKTLKTTDDFELRHRAQMELLKRGNNLDKFIALAMNTKAKPEARVMALGAAAQHYNAAVKSMLLAVLADEHPQLRRVAAETLSRNVPKTDVDRDLIYALTLAIEDDDAAVKRSAALALGELASLLPAGDALRQEAATQIASRLANIPIKESYLFDGVLRGLERLDQDGLDHLEIWLTGENSLLRETAVFAVQSLRTRAGADLLDRLLTQDQLQLLSPDQQARVIATYRDIIFDPPIKATAITEWMEKQNDLPLSVQLACMETLGAVPGGDKEVMNKLATSLLTNNSEEVRQRVITSIGDTDLKTLSPNIMEILLNTNRSFEERMTVLNAFSKLRSYSMHPRGRTAPGVELVLDELISVAEDDPDLQIQLAALELLAEVDYEKAVPTAEKLLQSDDLTKQVTAVRVLGRRSETARRLAKQFLDGDIDRGLLPQIAEALERHQRRDETGEIKKLLEEVFKGGLLVNLNPEEIAKVESLVKTTGNPENGKKLFLEKRTQCINCHKIEGVGHQVGPDLTKIWETHTVGKIMESILDPSREVKEGYATWNVVTEDGLVYSGLKVKEDAQELILRDSSGKEIRIPADEIDEKIESNKSLMPEGVISQLSYQEFIDLVAFLKDRESQQAMRELK